MVIAALSETIPIGDLSAAVWVCGVLLLLLTAILGFMAGVAWAPRLEQRALARARRRVRELLPRVFERLDRAQQSIEILQELTDVTLTNDQLAKLDHKRSALAQTLAVVLDRHTEHAPDSPELEWQRTPVHPVTQLPDRTAFDANLDSLLQQPCENGLLAVRMDKAAQLCTRFGEAEVGRLLAQLAGVVCRSARDSDLICHYDDQTLAVLMPGGGIEHAAAIRTAVRQAHFRVDETGAEVLVTASFGYTVCLPNDQPDLVLSQALLAVTRSSRQGRNQLHAHTAGRVTRCTS